MGTIRPNRGRRGVCPLFEDSTRACSETGGVPEPTTLLLERVQEWPAALPANEPHRDRPGDLHARITSPRRRVCWTDGFGDMSTGASRRVREVSVEVSVPIGSECLRCGPGALTSTGATGDRF